MAQLEFEFIQSIKSMFKCDPDILGIGDDAAVLKIAKDTETIWSTDCLVEGVHFDLAHEDPYWIGWKLGAVNISDMAAMGGVPKTALLSIAIPKQENSKTLSQLLNGLSDCFKEYEVSLIGGDTSSSKNGLFLNLAIQGQAIQKPILRSSAKVGDAVMVTGALGGSLLGRHLKIRPRVAQAKWLSGYCINAMIDISDGLAGDMINICDASNCYVDFWEGKIPIHPDAIEMSSKSNKSALDHALSDGEDFELLFTLSQDVKKQVLSEWPFADCALSEIGVIKGAGPSQLLGASGVEIRKLQRTSFEHKF